MRWYGQLAVIAVLGAAGYGGWRAYQSGVLSAVPVLGAYLPAAGPAPPKGQTAPQAPPPVVEIDAVRTGRVVETREAVGTVRAFESITVTAKAAGVVQKISFEEGQKVKAGDVLLRLDDEERRADIEQAQAEIQRAMAQRDESSARLERAVALRRTGAGTEAQVTDLTAQVKTLESAIASAEARRRAAEARLEDVVVRAPFAGRLGTRSVSVGAYSSPGTRITTLDDLSRVRLDFAVPENLLGQLQPGQIVRATSAAYGQRAFEGRVSVIDPRVDPVTRTVRLTAEFPNPDEALKPGMFLSVALTVNARNDAVVIPEEAVVGEGLQHLVYVEGQRGRAPRGPDRAAAGGPRRDRRGIAARRDDHRARRAARAPRPDCDAEADSGGRAGPVRRGGSGSERGGRSGGARSGPAGGRESGGLGSRAPSDPAGRQAADGAARAGRARLGPALVRGLTPLVAGAAFSRPRGEEGSARRAQSTRPKPA